MPLGRVPRHAEDLGAVPNIEQLLSGESALHNLKSLDIHLACVVARSSVSMDCVKASAIQQRQCGVTKLQRLNQL